MADVRTMDIRDRPWVNAYVTVVCGPFSMPSLNTIRDAVAALADGYPHSRLTWGFGKTENTWTTGRPVDSIVVQRDWDDPPNYGAILDQMASDGSLEPPLTFIRYPNHFGMRMSHSLGDGPIFMSMVASVLLTAVNGEVVPFPAVPAGRLPSVRAAVRTFGRNPALVRTTLRDRHRPAAPSPSATRPWAPSRHTVYTAVDVQLTNEIYAWGKEFAPDASRFAIQASLLLKALSRAGLAISDDVRVMVDLRGYLGTELIDGNFLAGVPVTISRNSSPEQISATMRATRASGRPLANQLATCLRVRGPLPMPDSVLEGAAPEVTFSYLGAPPLVEWLPYVQGQQHVYAASVPPAGPQGLTFLHGQNDGAMIVNTAFNDNVVDPSKVRDALDLICSDPIGLLSDSEAGR